MVAEIRFPVSRIPEKGRLARLVGLYPQLQEGFFLQRVRAAGGRLTREQWQGLARIQTTFTVEPLHLTTRQDLEIHGLSAEAVPAAQSQMAAVGLTGLGACGDTIRNVTVCPCSGTTGPDLLPLAGQITALLQEQDGAFGLPRKFKVSLSACAERCGQPWINDLGLTALRDGGGWKFEAIVAGSLGAKPETALAYPRRLEPGEVLPFSLAALRVFAAHGDRERRHQARLRHVRQHLGNHAFLTLLDETFEAVEQERYWPAVVLAELDRSFTFRRRLQFADGNLSVEAIEALAELAGRDDLQVRLSNHHEIAVFGSDEPAMDAALLQTGLATFVHDGARVVACPGVRWCSHGLTDTGKLAAGVRDRLNGMNVGDLLIAISGCPNGCAQSSVADVGAGGKAAGAQMTRRDVWDIYAGGECGQGPRLGQAAASRLEHEDAVDLIAALAVKAGVKRQNR